jgi:hypothetical protein
MQLKASFDSWPKENLDMAVFLSLYAYLTDERHCFMGVVRTWCFHALDPLFELVGLAFFLESRV